jgi:ATP-dependent Zn protease
MINLNSLITYLYAFLLFYVVFGILTQLYSRSSKLRRSVYTVHALYEPNTTKSLYVIDNVQVNDNDIILHMGKDVESVVIVTGKELDSFKIIDLDSHVQMIYVSEGTKHGGELYAVVKSESNDKYQLQKEVEPIRWYHWLGLASYKGTGDAMSDYQDAMYSDEIFTKKVKECLTSRNEFKVSMDDIIGLEDTKSLLREMLMFSLSRPDLFKGIRKPARTVLLYGPPGNGKTMLATAMAADVNYSFLCISASALSSHWQGGSEKLMRAVFRVAKQNQPCLIFFDEIDSMLRKRTAYTGETNTRTKTEFMIGLNQILREDSKHQILVVAASNTPHLLDEAVLRRFDQRVYIDIPNEEERKAMLELKLDGHCDLTEDEYYDIARQTEGFSHSDLYALCGQAGLYANREANLDARRISSLESLPSITYQNVCQALQNTSPSIQSEQLESYRSYKV